MKFHFVVNIGLLVLNQNAEFLTIDRVNQNEYKIISFMLPLVNKTLDILKYEKCAFQKTAFCS